MMQEPICITKVICTEYNGSVKTVDLVELGQVLFLKKSSNRLIEDALCELFTNPRFLCVKVKWETRDCTIREIVEFNENASYATVKITKPAGVKIHGNRSRGSINASRRMS